MTYEEIYQAGYEDGVHDGYYSSSIEDGIEEKHFGKSYQEQQPNDDCISRQAVLEQARDYGSETFLIPVNSIIALPPVTPTFPKGATNGDMMKNTFPNVPVKIFEDMNTVIFGNAQFDLDWWDAPYKGVNDDSN